MIENIKASAIISVIITAIIIPVEPYSNDFFQLNDILAWEKSLLVNLQDKFL